MDVSFHPSQSTTKLFNQTMSIEATETTTVTNCIQEDMSVVVGHKRKTIETITVDEAIANVTKSVKMRKMNDENVDPQSENTILHHVEMNISSNDDSNSNLNATRMYDVDVSVDDLSSQSAFSFVPPNKVCLFDSSFTPLLQIGQFFFFIPSDRPSHRTNSIRRQ